MRDASRKSCIQTHQFVLLSTADCRIKITLEISSILFRVNVAAVIFENGFSSPLSHCAFRPCSIFQATSRRWHAIVSLSSGRSSAPVRSTMLLSVARCAGLRLIASSCFNGDDVLFWSRPTCLRVGDSPVSPLALLGRLTGVTAEPATH